MQHFLFRYEKKMLSSNITVLIEDESMWKFTKMLKSMANCFGLRMFYYKGKTE